MTAGPGLFAVVVEAGAGAGALSSLVGTALYVRDVVRGRTVPHRGAWCVWTVVAVVAVATHAADGGRWGLLVLGAQAVGSGAVLLLALRRGSGRVTRSEALLLAVAAAGVVAWLLSGAPVEAAAGATLADGAGLVAVVPKVRRDARSETASTYALAAAGGLVTGLAVPPAHPALLLFPGYYCLANAAMTALVLHCRRRSPRAGAVAPQTFPPPPAAPPRQSRPHPRPVPVTCDA